MVQVKDKVSDYVVHGRVTWSNSGESSPEVIVTAMDSDLLIDDRLGTTTTDQEGRFRISYGPEKFRGILDRAPDVYLLIHDKAGHLLASTKESTVRNAGRSLEIFVQVPGGEAEPERATIDVGGLAVDRRLFAQLSPAAVLNAARAIMGGEASKAEQDLEALSPELSLKRLTAELCLTRLVRFLRDAVSVKRWPREVELELEEILIGYRVSAAYAGYSCGSNFTINYETTGPEQPPSTDTGGNITMPGTGTVVGATTGGNGVPDYIEKLCFWLENALSTYTNPPFSLRNPVSGGAIPVFVTGTSPGFAGGGSMTIGRNLNDDLLAAVPSHELMHLIQERYRTAGSAGGWDPGMTEGGAVLGEDVIFDTHNRYIVQATSSGTLANPATALNYGGADYFLALFLKYISEQQSSRINPGDEPAIGVDTYRALLERCDLDGYTNAALETAIAGLPWYQTFYRFDYLDAARLDETSSETLLGNFWLACYLKDFGTPVQINGVSERRFDFMEDEENTTWDTIFNQTSVSTLGAVALTTVNLPGGGTVTLSSLGSVDPFAARFFKVNVAAAVDTLRVNFAAGAGFSRPLVQIVLVEPGNVVRDILRSDRTSWARTIANARGGTNLDHILIVVAGTDVGGPYTLTAQSTVAAPDVMVTRWHHLAGTHYEIDSRGWAWTWASPDIWVDNNANGMADSEVFFNQNNKLFIRLRNQGHAAASGISVNFWYQDASGGLSDSAWLPVQNVANATQSLTGLSLPAGATNQWSVDWAPIASGTSSHFCVRAVVAVPGDPNTDNKRILSNFGNVIVGSPYVDLYLLRRLPQRFSNVRIDLIPRTGGRWVASAADLQRARNANVAGQEVVDAFQLRRMAQLGHRAGSASPAPEFVANRPCSCTAKMSRRELQPDPMGNYPTDPRALPPGLANVPLVTIAHIVDNKVLGGFTWAIRERQG